MQNLLENLNEEQTAAVTLANESALVIAGAGSGKTRVLTTRIAWLLKTGQTLPRNILAVTFTNKAARELVSRLSDMASFNVRDMWVGTFHGLCNRLLRRHSDAAGLPSTFQIMDATDQLASIRRLLKANELSEDIFPPREVAHFINRNKEKGDRSNMLPFSNDRERQFVELYKLYEEQCERESAVDFAELLLRSYELLRRNQVLREHYQARFRHILVDEFQDTNDLQYKWLELMADRGRSAAIFAVGDDDQSIYAFRGANVGNMRTFQNDFGVSTIIRLEQNYRSYSNILEAANALISHNTERHGKNLRTDLGHGEPIRFYLAEDDQSEARYLVDESKRLINEGWLRSEIAILYRSNAQSRVIEHALVRDGIPYRVHGGLRFYERAEIKHALAYLQLVDNVRIDSAFLRVVNFPPRRIGLRTVEELQDMARRNDVALYDAIDGMPGRMKSTINAFAQLIESIKNETRLMSLPAMIEVLLERSTLLAHYRNEKDGANRIENLSELVGSAKTFLAEHGIDEAVPALSVLQFSAEDEYDHQQEQAEAAAFPAAAEMTVLTAFLTSTSLEAGEGQPGEHEDAIQLMTVHAAKGLEFDAVFVSGLEEGLFPHSGSSDIPEALEEERRLMYVAITRARKHLYLTMAQRRMLYGYTRDNSPSRFFRELPPEVLSRVETERMPGLHERKPGVHGYSAPETISDTVSQDWSSGAGPDQVEIPSAPVMWRVGERVFHNRFGEGVIMKLESSGPSIHASIHFGSHGTKLLDLGVARLVRLN